MLVIILPSDAIRILIFIIFRNMFVNILQVDSTLETTHIFTVALEKNDQFFLHIAMERSTIFLMGKSSTISMAIFASKL